MNEAEMTINDRLFCIALLEGSNVDEATKILTKTQRKKSHGGTDVRMDPIVLELTLQRFTVNENQTLNILFNQNHSREHHMGNRLQNQKGRGGYRSAKGRSHQRGGWGRMFSMRAIKSLDARK